MKSLKKVTKLSKDEKYILTCSYGPDSMALFNYLLVNNFNFVVAHVNYHILEQADDDENGIRKFAKLYNIPVYVLDTNMPEGVNEEMWAREVRYNYFVALAKQLGIKNVLVAHNKDDNIETYLLQKQRGGIYLTYGLKKLIQREGINIIRPLLSLKKQELEDYCKDNKIPYSIDPSNADTKFKRNEIRKKLATISDCEKESILEEIKEKNAQNLTILKKFKSLGLPNFVDTTKKLFKSVNKNDFQLILIYILRKKGIYTSFSLGRCQNLLDLINERKANHVEKINGNYLLVLTYGIIKVINEPQNYCYVFKENCFENQVFKLNKNSKDFQKIEKEFPLTIKPAIDGISYKKNNQTLKVNREYISWKMPLYLRKVWPGIFDKDGKLIFVPHYQTKIKKGGLLNFREEDL